MQTTSSRHLFLAGMACVLLGLHAQHSIAQPPAPQALRAQPPGSLLVLRNGRIATGLIRHSAAGFVVQRPTGSLVVPYEKVLIQANDLKDAYLKQSRMNRFATPDQHVELARWCLTYGLYEESKTELSKALEMDSKHTVAQDMLDKLDRLLTNSSADTAVEQPRTSDGFAASETKSLAGLTPELALEFVTKIQPILMNRCGNAACHSARSQNAFRLQHVRLGGRTHRVRAERNLSAVLKLIDMRRPSRSALIEKPAGNHGRAHRPIFSGAGGATQQAALHSWTIRVARSNSLESAKTNPTVVSSELPAAADGLSRPPISQTPLRQTNTASLSDKTTQSGGGVFLGQRRVTSPRSDRATALVTNKRADEFDPSVFNRETQRRRQRPVNR